MSKGLLIFRIAFIVISILVSVIVNKYMMGSCIITYINNISVNDKYYKYTNMKRHNIAKKIWKNFIIVQTSYLILCALVYFFATPNLILLSAGKNLILFSMLLSSNILFLNISYRYIDNINPPFSISNILICVAIIILGFFFSDISYSNRQYVDSKIESTKHYEIVTEENKYLKKEDITFKKNIINNDNIEYSFYYIESEGSYKHITLKNNKVYFEKSDDSLAYIDIIVENRNFYNMDEKDSILKSKLENDTRYIIYLNEDLYNQITLNNDSSNSQVNRSKLNGELKS